MFLVDGDWTDWEDWGSCSVTCGEGFKKRTRECYFKDPSCRGKTCGTQENEEETENCVDLIPSKFFRCIYLPCLGNYFGPFPPENKVAQGQKFCEGGKLIPLAIFDQI